MRIMVHHHSDYLCRLYFYQRLQIRNFQTPLQQFQNLTVTTLYVLSNVSHFKPSSVLKMISQYNRVPTL